MKQEIYRLKPFYLFFTLFYCVSSITFYPSYAPFIPAVTALLSTSTSPFTYLLNLPRAASLLCVYESVSLLLVSSGFNPF